MNTACHTHGLQAALDQARDEAGWRGLERFGPEFYLESLLARRQGLPVRVLRNLNVPLDALQIDLLRHIQEAAAQAPRSGRRCEPIPDDQAEAALTRARTLAGRMELEWIGQAHLLLALLEDPATPVAAMLERFGVRFEDARAEVERCMEGDREHHRAITENRGVNYSPLLQEILKLAQEEARLWRQPQIEPEHLMGAMLRKGEGDAIRILRASGIDLSDLAIRLEALIDVGAETPSGTIETSYTADLLLEQTGANARGMGHPLVNSEHLLLALMQTRALPHRVLSDFHLSEGRIAQEIERLTGLKSPAPSKPSQQAEIVQLAPPPESGFAREDTETQPEAGEIPLRVAVTQTPEGTGLPLPAYETPDSAGMDLRAAVPDDAPLVLQPGGWALVPTGLKIALPRGFEAQIRPRSGLAFKHGIGVLNSPGTIDADYRGEVKIILFNFSPEPFTIRRGERIAQMVFARVNQLQWERVDILPETRRGEGGFGHTGR